MNSLTEGRSVTASCRHAQRLLYSCKASCTGGGGGGGGGGDGGGGGGGGGGWW